MQLKMVAFDVSNSKSMWVCWYSAITHAHTRGVTTDSFVKDWNITKWKTVYSTRCKDSSQATTFQKCCLRQFWNFPETILERWNFSHACSALTNSNPIRGLRSQFWKLLSWKTAVVHPSNQNFSRFKFSASSLQFTKSKYLKSNGRSQESCLHEIAETARSNVREKRNFERHYLECNHRKDLS